ncbi:GlcG/HbpS family heme-binding protein [Nocardia violaceofusca]|uniref:GlcG/HbpS family heme-binding protein n=1 Tax=Nocardia violaceofusca TaxID=941182 RepID=UPI000A4843D7|nr:heme-binding protein [Nocardia violaceofusca]
MWLTLDEAHAISARIRSRAAELDVRVTVAVVDEGGHVRVLDRMDGAPPLSARIAPAKAAAVALFHRDGGELQQLQKAWPALFDRIDQLAPAPIVAGAGSRLIRRDGVVLGAVAVSGGRPEQDDECAEFGLGVPTRPAPGPV